MPTDSDPARFRADATARYRALRGRLLRLIAVAAGGGFLIGALIGLAVGSSNTRLEAPPGGFWLAGGLIGLAAGAVPATAVAGVIWLVASLFYVVSQDGA